MISDYYNRQFSLEKMNAKSIKLKSNQANIQPFMIPDSHFHPNSKMYEQLKSKCQSKPYFMAGIKTEFSFITNQIQRELRQKKEKQQESKTLSKALFEKENREQIQRQMTLTCQKLMKLHQFRKSNFEGFRPKRLLKNNEKTYLSLNFRITQVVGLPVTYSPKNTSQKSERKKTKTLQKSRFRYSAAEE